MNRIRLAFPADPYQHAALNAIGEAIDDGRRFLASPAAHDRPDLADTVARRVRTLEHAAWQLGETLNAYLPAVYRTPPVHRPPSDGETTAPGQPPSTPRRNLGAVVPPAAAPPEPATREGRPAKGRAVRAAAGGPSGRPRPHRERDDAFVVARPPAGDSPQPVPGGPALTVAPGPGRQGWESPSPPASTSHARGDIPTAPPTPGPAQTRTQPCCHAMPPEHHDWCRLVAVIADRKGERYVSPLGDQRERPVGCIGCGAPTFALNQRCDRCEIEHRLNALAHLGQGAVHTLIGEQP